MPQARRRPGRIDPDGGAPSYLRRRKPPRVEK
jgi:hypothetical protein